jgi:hypothetical protein
VFLSLIGNDEYTLSEEEILNSVSYIEKEEEKYSSKIDKEYNYFYSIYKKAIQDREFLRIIEVLPKNIKSCKQYKENGLITFYKRENTAIYGFIYNENEIDLYEGLKILECDKEEEQLTIPENNFYNLLERHKDKVKQNFNANMELSKNDKELIIYLKEKGLTEYVNKIRNKELICNSKTALDDLKNGKSIDEIFKVFTKENKKDIILNEYLMK